MLFDIAQIKERQLCKSYFFMLMKLHQFIERGNVLKNNSLPIHIAGICIFIINFDLNCFKSFLLHGYFVVVFFFL